MNVRSQLHCQPVYRPRWLSALIFVAATAGLALGTSAQQLTPPPFTFPPSFQVPLPAQAPGFSVRRTQAKSLVKTVLRTKPPTKAQLNQALIAEAYRRNMANVTRPLAQGADSDAAA